MLHVLHVTRTYGVMCRYHGHYNIQNGNITAYDHLIYEMLNIKRTEYLPMLFAIRMLNINRIEYLPMLFAIMIKSRSLLPSANIIQTGTTLNNYGS